MQHTPDAHRDPPNPSPPVAPPQPSPTRSRLVKLEDRFLSIQPIWVSLAGLFVYISYLLDLGAAFPWVGLAFAFLPFPLRVLRSGLRALRTPFDLPVAVFLAGALIGFCVSDDRSISLGALQCILAVTLFYYSWVNSPAVANHIKRIIVFLAVGFLIIYVLSAVDVSFVESQPNFVFGGSGTHHGLAMYLAAVAAILFGMAAFDRVRSRRLLGLALFLVFLVIVVLMTWESLGSLFRGVSVTGRWPIWEKTADLLSESPLAGLGLGCWALARWGTVILGTDEIGGITHAHNAYLELYSNTGILGALALIVALGIGLKLSMDIIKSPRTNPWYGFGIGVILACIATLLVAAVESAAIGVPMVAAKTYYYVISPIAWTLCGLLAIAHRQVTKTPGP